MKDRIIVINRFIFVTCLSTHKGLLDAEKYPFFERCFLITSIIIAINSLVSTISNPKDFFQLIDGSSGIMAIKILIYTVIWLAVVSVPYIAALTVSRKKSLIMKWIIITIVAVSDLVVVLSVVHPVGGLTEAVIAFIEVVPATVGVVFIMSENSKSWLSSNY